jgi:hypothetical protein
MSLEQTIALLSKGEIKESLEVMKKDAKEFKNTAGLEIYKAFQCLFHPNAPHKEHFKEIAEIYYSVLLFPYK